MQATAKKNLSIRLAPELRQQLEFIAGKELRTLANQITVFLTRGVNDYLSNEGNSKEYKDYLVSVSSNEQ